MVHVTKPEKATTTPVIVKPKGTNLVGIGVQLSGLYQPKSLKKLVVEIPRVKVNEKNLIQIKKYDSKSICMMQGMGYDFINQQGMGRESKTLLNLFRQELRPLKHPNQKKNPILEK